MDTQATKRPWKFTISPKHNRPQISGDNGHQICLMWRDGEMEANALLIVKAVNEYGLNKESIKLLDTTVKALIKEKEELVEALKEVLICSHIQSSRRIARKFLSKAGEL